MFQAVQLLWEVAAEAWVTPSTEGMPSEESQEPGAEPWGLRATDHGAVGEVGAGTTHGSHVGRALRTRWHC